MSEPFPRRGQAARPGFSLMEVLVAMALFLVATTALISIFPAAILLQREAIRSVKVASAQMAIESVMRGMDIPEDDLTGGSVAFADMPAYSLEVFYDGLNVYGPDYDTDQQVRPFPTFASRRGQRGQHRPVRPGGPKFPDAPHPR